jgi:hypothetical protein
MGNPIKMEFRLWEIRSKCTKGCGKSDQNGVKVVGNPIKMELRLCEIRSKCTKGCGKSDQNGFTVVGNSIKMDKRLWEIRIQPQQSSQETCRDHQSWWTIYPDNEVPEASETLQNSSRSETIDLRLQSNEFFNTNEFTVIQALSKTTRLTSS